jgi:hypothetical protein
MILSWVFLDGKCLFSLLEMYLYDKQSKNDHVDYKLRSFLLAMTILFS